MNDKNLSLFFRYKIKIKTQIKKNFNLQMKRGCIETKRNMVNYNKNLKMWA